LTASDTTGVPRRGRTASAVPRDRDCTNFATSLDERPASCFARVSALDDLPERVLAADLAVGELEQVAMQGIDAAPKGTVRVHKLYDGEVLSS